MLLHRDTIEMHTPLCDFPVLNGDDNEQYLHLMITHLSVWSGDEEDIYSLLRTRLQAKVFCFAPWRIRQLLDAFNVIVIISIVLNMTDHEEICTCMPGIVSYLQPSSQSVAFASLSSHKYEFMTGQHLAYSAATRHSLHHHKFGTQHGSIDSRGLRYPWVILKLYCWRCHRT